MAISISSVSLVRELLLWNLPPPSTTIMGKTAWRRSWFNGNGNYNGNFNASCVAGPLGP
ncbi:MAG: hypothetical protein R2828_03045 [Saprospiraceae bacterium]